MPKFELMYYNDNTIVYFRGEFVKATEASISAYDQSIHYGYAAFEGIRCYSTENGIKIFKAEEHYNRLEFSSKAIGIPYPYNNDELIEISYDLLRKNSLGNAYLRPLVYCPPNMVLTKAKGSHLLIAAWEWGAYLGTQLLRLKTSSYRRISSASFMVEAKVSGHYVNSILATQEAKDLGYDEALLLDMNGFVAEGPGANFFMEKDGILFTPERGSILPGITRATVIELCHVLDYEVVEKKILPDEVYEADAAFYCGTAAEVIGIHSLDDKVFPLKWEQSLGEKIQKAYRDLVLQKYSQPAHQVA